MPRQSSEEDKVPFQAFQEAHDIEVQEILKEGIPSLLMQYTHYYISMEDKFSFPSIESTMVEPSCPHPLSQFLRVPQI